MVILLLLQTAWPRGTAGIEDQGWVHIPNPAIILSSNDAAGNHRALLISIYELIISLREEHQQRVLSSSRADFFISLFHFFFFF